jgi:hypothetical protein
MAITKAQATIWEKARSLGSGGQGVGLTDGMCTYIIARIAADLGVSASFPELPQDPPVFFTREPLSNLRVEGKDCKALFDRLVSTTKDSDMYFACLAALHKARLKYERILSTQPIPTLEQVGPRGLLQYGKLSPSALAGFLFWRKWFFDIDNRAGQETGYLFEPIIAYAVGGTPAPASKSPVKRARDRKKGRQVDCILDKRAYEIKIRVTIAASGQGRWQEELDFPIDCRRSGYIPVLVCMDGTPNAKLDALTKAFRHQKGEVYVGENAWVHLRSLAGTTMSIFLESYVRAPIQRLIEKADERLPDLAARWSEDAIEIELGNDLLEIAREQTEESEEPEELPEDADEGIPGP